MVLYGEHFVNYGGLPVYKEGYGFGIVEDDAISVGGVYGHYAD